MNPFQLYLNVSVIFFLLLGITNKLDSDKNLVNNVVTATNNLDSLSQKNLQQLDTVLNNVKDQINSTIPVDSTKTKVIANLGSVIKFVESETEKDKKDYVYYINSDSTKTPGLFNKIKDFQHYHKEFPSYNNEQALDSLGYKKTFWNKFYYQQIINAFANFKQLKSDGGKNYMNKLISYISISLFIFLPVFTLFLKLLYIRKKYFYMEHLVFVFHTQTVFFLLFIIFYLLNFFVKMDNVAWVHELLFLLYLYKALRYFYEQGRFKTILKFVLLNSCYLFLALFGLSILAILSFTIN